MNACNYTNRSEEVPLGVECALPYLTDSALPPSRGRAQRTNPNEFGRPVAVRRWQGPAWKRMRLGLR